MKLYGSEEALQAGLAAFLRHYGTRVGMVSEDVPLISNLDVWINIALIRQYHENLPADAARQEVMGCLRRLGLEKIAGKRNPALTGEQRFQVMLLRAAMVAGAVIVIDRPFRILTAQSDSRLIDESLLAVDGLYDRSAIFDYHWFRDRYRTDHAA